MAASCSTLKAMYESRLLRMDPNLGLGHFTTKIRWMAAPDCIPLKACQCVEGPKLCTATPAVHFLSSTRRKLFPRSGMLPVDMAKLPTEGAIIFGCSSGWKLDARHSMTNESQDKVTATSSITSGSGSAGSGNLSGVSNPVNLDSSDSVLAPTQSSTLTAPTSAGSSAGS